MDVRDILEKWKLNHLVKIFEEQAIDEISILKELTGEQINFLAPNIGDRIRLKKAIQSLTEDHNKEQDKEVLEEPLQKRIKLNETFVENSDENEILTAPIAPSLSNLPILFLNNLEDPSTPSTSNIKTPIEFYHEGNVSQATTETYYTSDTSSITIVDGNRLQNSSVGVFDLEKFLKNDILGEALLVKGRKTRLTSTDQDRLCELLIKHLINTYGKLSPEDFLILSEKIGNTFPNENRASFYVAAIPKNLSHNNVHEKARGKLIDKQRNLLYLIRKLKYDKPEETVLEESYLQAIPQEATDSQIWLRKNTDPHYEVLENWRKSLCLRKATDWNTISEFLDHWPILKHSIAPELINYDFAHVHKLENFDLGVAFDKLFETTLERRRILLSPADNTILQLLDSEITSDSRRAIQLYLLAALVPPKTRTKIRKIHWKPSISEAREGILVHVNTPGDIENAKKKQIDSMFSKGLTVQPYLIIVGQNLSNISQALVIINENTYQCPTVLEALDFCMKSYIVLDAKYPFQSQHLWYLIQWCVYQYRATTDPKILFINDLLN